MKLLYLVHQFYPKHYTGTEKFIYKLARMQQLAGHKVKVVTYSFYEPDFYDMEQGDILYKEFIYGRIEILAFRHKRIPETVHSALNMPDCREFSLRVLTEFSPDIVHSGHIMRVPEFIHAARSLGIPYIMTLTDYWMLCHKGIMLTDERGVCHSCKRGHACSKCGGLMPSQKIKRYNDALEILRGARFLASPSRFLADMYNREFPGLGVQVVPHGIDYETIKRREHVYSQDCGNLTFGFCGTLSWHKGAHIAVKAAGLIPNIDFRLLIYGSGEAAYIRTLTDVPDKRIRLMGEYTEADIGQVYAEIDVLIVPSLWYENYPLALHEALASGIPVIASAMGGMAERIRDNFNGFTFPPGNIGALANIIARITENPALLDGLKKNIRHNPPPSLEQEAWQYNVIYSERRTGA